MSYPPPPGPQGPPPQNPPSQNPGWQQPTYQPQGGNWAAPPYGTPPPKNRAGLIIFLIVLLVAAIIGIVGFVSYRLTSGGSDDGGTAPAAPVSTKATTAPSKAPTQAVPSKPVASKPVPTRTVPSKPVTSKPAAATKQAAFALAGQFAAALNADNTDAAVALACPDTKEIFPSLISAWIKAPTKLTVTDAVIGENPFLVPISGTTHGQKMGGMVIVQGSCIRAFAINQS
ncbi:hypothetical protein OHA70_11335 [Kribbella sp. NBC_00382]|uniref:hypothetical protein n=1 Tax=Kribbella sp. NBC_00382 TaxID=2975967 RepID=UPI002E22E3D7